MKKLPKTSGIYTITNLVNGKMYVGYTKNLRIRKSDHFTQLRNNNHGNIHLQKSYDKHGFNAFIFEILEECEEQFLCSQEHYWCNMLNVHDDRYGYNIKLTHPECKCLHSRNAKLKIKKARSNQKNIFVKKVYQYSKEGDLINSFNSAVQASKETNISYHKILWACQGKSNNLTTNYLWSYKFEQNIIKLQKPQIRKVYQYDLEGNLVNTFNHIKEACEFLKDKNGGSLYLYLQGKLKTKTYKNYIWKRED